MPFNPQLSTRDIFWAQGTLSAAVTEDFQRDLDSWLAATTGQALVMDFTEVDFLDSAILVVLVDAYRKLQPQGKVLMLSGVSPELKIIFELTQLDRIFPIYKTPETALTSLDNFRLAA
jgi:anti-anti-sigma factor